MKMVIARTTALTYPAFTSPMSGTIDSGTVKAAPR